MGADGAMYPAAPRVPAGRGAGAAVVVGAAVVAGAAVGAGALVAGALVVLEVVAGCCGVRVDGGAVLVAAVGGVVELGAVDDAGGSSSAGDDFVGSDVVGSDVVGSGAGGEIEPGISVGVRLSMVPSVVLLEFGFGPVAELGALVGEGSTKASAGRALGTSLVVVAFASSSAGVRSSRSSADVVGACSASASSTVVGCGRNTTVATTAIVANASNAATDLRFITALTEYLIGCCNGNVT